MRKFKWLLCLIMILALAGCSVQEPAPSEGGSKDEYSRSEFVVGTIVSVKIFEDGSEAVLDDIFARLAEIEARMSFNTKESEIKDINAAAGKNPVAVSQDTFDVVKRAVEFAEESHGLFDPTIGPLVQLWGIGSETAAVPSDTDRLAAIELIDWMKVELDPDTYEVYLKEEGMELDLGAIAKGYASDEVVHILKENGVSRGIINLGGNVFAYGEKEDGAAWRIGVQNPFSTRGEYIAILDVKNKTVVTSGIYERFFEEDGVRYHHILDTQTGYPVENNLASVTVVTDNSMNADAMSTILFSAGVEEGMEYIKAYHPDVAAIFVTKDRKVYTTDLGAYNIKWTDESFELQ